MRTRWPWLSLVAVAAVAAALWLRSGGDEPGAADARPASAGAPSDRSARAGAERTDPGVAWSATAAAPADARALELEAALAGGDPERLHDAIAALLADPSSSDERKFAVLWRHYRARRGDPAVGRLLLDSTMALREHGQLAVLAGELERGDAPGWARARLLMLIGQRHADAGQLPAEEAQRQRARALELIARALDDPDDAVAREAAINHARLGQGADAQDALDRAWRRRLLSREEYLRETLLRLPSLADPALQRRAIESVQASTTGADAATMRVVVDTVAITLQDAASARALDASSRAGLLRLLAAHPPAPSSDATQYAMTAATSYYDWALATAVLQGVPEATLGAHLARIAAAPPTTPAQAAALMLSPHAPAIARAAAAEGEAATLQAKLQAALRATVPATAAHAVYAAALEAAAAR